MVLNWKPFTRDTAERCRVLTQLFQTALANEAPVEQLCKIAVDISRLEPFDRRRMEYLSIALIDYAPDVPASVRFRAQTLRLLGRSDEGVGLCKAVLAKSPEDINIRWQLATFLLEKNELSEAESLLEALFEEASLFAGAVYAECLLRQRNFGLAHTVLSRWEAAEPQSTAMLALKHACAVAMDDKQALRELQATELIAQFDEASEKDDLSTAELNSHLAQCISHSDAMVREPANTATMIGTQGFAAEVFPEPLLDRLLRAIRHNAERYVGERAQHPYFSKMPDEVGITCWAVSLEKSGHQAAHHHPAGWVSGVYYVDLGAYEAGPANAGAIEFWRPPEKLVGNCEANTIQITPLAGTMLLFPSYAYHRTLPHDGESSRLSIAFDIG